MIETIINWLFIFLLFSISIRMFRFLFVHYTVMNKYKNYLEIYNYFLDAAYQIVYKDQIIGYSMSGVTPQREELETAKRNFVKLAFELMGQHNMTLLITFFGTRDVLITNMLSYFQDKVDSDEISKILSIQEETEKPK